MRGFSSLAMLFVYVSLALAGDWPQWLGPTRDGVSPEKVAPWKEAPKKVWSAPVGEGHSSPVVAGGRVFIHDKVKDKDVEELVALVTSGCLSAPSTVTTGSATASSGTAQLPVPAPAGVAAIRGFSPEPDDASLGRPPLSSTAVQREMPTCSIEPGIGGAVVRGASSDGDKLDVGLDRPPLNNTLLPREVPTCSIEPVLSLLAGDASSQARQDAAQSLALMGVTGAAAAFHRAGPGARTLHQAAGVTNDLLQPDDETTPMKKSRPPLYFTVGFGF